MLTDFITILSDKEAALYQHPEKPIYFFKGNNDELEGKSIAILGVKDARGFEANKGCADAPDFIRQALYSLHNFPLSLPIIDLGNILPGATFADTHLAVKEVVRELMKLNIITLILGGDMTLSLAQYKGMAHSDVMLDMVMVDERFTFAENDESAAPDIQDFLFRIFTDRPNRISQFTLLGYQTYFIQSRDLDLLDQMKMNSHRLGAVRDDLKEMEPIVRDADLLAFNISALKSCDAPGYAFPSPNGFFSDEACQLLRYAGASDKMQCVGIYNYNPSLDHQGITAIGIAQMIWYFIDGIHLRRADYPIVDEKDFQKFIVSIQGEQDEIVFMKSIKSDRWWMQVPTLPLEKKLYRMVPCTYKDYLTAMESEVPERWLHAFSRYN